MEGLDGDKEVESVLIMATPPSKDVKSRKRKREVEGLGSPSADAVSEKNLRETGSHGSGTVEDSSLQEWPRMKEIARGRTRDGGFHQLDNGRRLPAQRTKMKRGSTSGQTWEVDVGKEWVSNEHQANGKQVTSDPLEKNRTRNTSRPWWVALETLKELKDCLKKLDTGVSRKRRNWATQQKAEINKLELGRQLK